MGLSHSSTGDSGCLYNKIEFAEVSQTVFRLIALKERERERDRASKISSVMIMGKMETQ